MHLILTGATGLVGSSVLDAMLRSAEVAKISILSRRPVPMAEDAKDPRIQVLIHEDFQRYEPDLLQKLKDADGCVWALGTSTTNVTEDQHVKITKDYALAAAKAYSTLKSSKPPFRFIYVSGEGATQSPGLFSPLFARVKGETEKLLSDLSTTNPLIRVDSVRPGFVDAAAHGTVQPYVPNYAVSGLGARIGIALAGPPIRHIFTWMHCPTEHLGRFLTDMAMGKVDGKLEGTGVFNLGSGWVVQNIGLRRISEL
ncbi:hypothetical protein BO83DRAFT_440522 [Aspergillus eucalypticola CBS 122712]|uniref:Nucleoside-diphosphate-sugar epimerase n=1 Tax=Aspergillus eucalypticola (strain CBS 122712 / IBT 29274) TaxID=1448314 RepID=A0A317UUZ7_ASPEC|nr:uncharacterized protein BO83DRAFT_440522 [Aspergillus eucalypticola CBS 122712]PWY64848.1 hypothetical protein BO83DRAFT_440522 [Aspergillus eucalypticola CBS 122712]